MFNFEIFEWSTRLNRLDIIIISMLDYLPSVLKQSEFHQQLYIDPLTKSPLPFLFYNGDFTTNTSNKSTRIELIEGTGAAPKI